MRDLIKRALGIKPPSSTEFAAYQRLRQKGFEPDRIIDVGAYEGNWTRMVRSVFAEVPVSMIEAQHGKIAILNAVCGELSDVTLISAVLGRTDGEDVTFYEMETGSSLRPENSNVPRREISMTTRTLDEVLGAAEDALFIKIDVQGSELDILLGGQKSLSRCEVVQLETALLPYNAGAPQLTEVVMQMDRWGFAAFDFASFIRPNGVDLVQADIIFVRTDSPLRTSHFIF